MTIRKTASKRPSDRASETARKITSQLQRMPDSDVYAMTFAGDRVTRSLAVREAHKRAEAYALGVMA